MSESAFGVDHGEFAKALKPANPMQAFKGAQKPTMPKPAAPAFKSPWQSGFGTGQPKPMKPLGGLTPLNSGSALAAKAPSAMGGAPKPALGGGAKPAAPKPAMGAKPAGAAAPAAPKPATPGK